MSSVDLSVLKEFTTVLKSFEETTNLLKKLRQVQYALMYMQFRTVGPQYLKDMTDSIPSDENLTTFIKIVKPTNKDVNDRLIRAGQVTLILNCIMRPLETELEITSMVYEINANQKDTAMWFKWFNSRFNESELGHTNYAEKFKSVIEE